MRSLQALLLGVAAGSLAIGVGSAAAQNAKGNPAPHAKNCSAYGAGFRYVPGADVCMRIGGWAGAEARGGRVNWGALNSNPGNLAAPGEGARGYLTTDVRAQTEYGTVRAYVSVGAAHQ